MRKINIGCGPYPQEGYINIDINPLWNPDIVRDVQKGLPFDDSSVGEVLASHSLEHLRTSDDLIYVMKEVYRVLIPEGIFDISLPLGN